MADIGRRRPTEAPVRLRLEGQEGQEVVDIGAHLRRAARPPGPDGRADIVDDRRCCGARCAHAPWRPRWVKSGLSMMIERVGPRRRRRRRRCSGCGCRIVGSRAMTAVKPITAISFEREEAASGLPPPSRAPPTPPKRTRSAPRRVLQRAHQLGAELVARFLAGDDPDRSGSAQPAAAPSTGRSTAIEKQAEPVGRARAFPPGRARRWSPRRRRCPEGRRWPLRPRSAARSPACRRADPGRALPP